MLGDRAFEALREDAKRRGVSADTLLNQIVLSYANFDRHVGRLHMIKLARPTFKRVLDAASDDAIIKAGHEAGTDVPGFLIVAKDNPMTTQAALAHLKDLSEYANLFEYAETIQGWKRTVTLGHELGKKGSLFLAHYAQAILEAAGNHPAFSVGDNSIVIELRERAGQK